jgi:hypothetical protein
MRIGECLPCTSKIRSWVLGAREVTRNQGNLPFHQVRWPSGLRRQTKDLVRKGVGSNPTLITFFAFSVHSEARRWLVANNFLALWTHDTP